MSDIVARIAHVIDSAYFVPGLNTHADAVRAAGAIMEIVAACQSEPDGLSAWSGWDKSDLPWSEAKHKDAVCRAVFGPTWSMEDAETLIGFIDRTWRAGGWGRG